MVSLRLVLYVMLSLEFFVDIAKLFKSFKFMSDMIRFVFQVNYFDWLLVVFCYYQ